MHRDSDNKDYIEGQLFVFDDRLRFSDEVKYQIEAALDYPFDDRTTFGASVEPSVLTAEKKRKPDGNGYILVRRATFSEEQELFASDEDEDGVSVAQASSVADEGAVTRTEVYRVLAFFIDIEPEPDDVDTEEEYAALMEHHRGQIEAGYKTLRAYAEQIEVKTLSNMQEVYYSLTNDPRYLGRPLWISVVTAVLNRAWDGVGEWHR